LTQKQVINNKTGGRTAPGEDSMQKIQDHYIGQFTLNDEETVLTMIRRGPVLIAGGSTNAGFIEEYEFEIMDSFSIDENIQAFVDRIEEDD
tara:strand:- start:40 stop:312 length:273 start_codon:yes stop_codon:yes gene_type:complete